jgi:hypothetical protein
MKDPKVEIITRWYDLLNTEDYGRLPKPDPITVTLLNSILSEYTIQPRTMTEQDTNDKQLLKG